MWDLSPVVFESLGGEDGGRLVGWALARRQEPSVGTGTGLAGVMGCVVQSRQNKGQGSTLLRGSRGVQITGLAGVKIGVRKLYDSK